MNVPLYEKIWMWAVGVLILAFLVTVGVTTAASALRPPSHVETIDPATVWSDPRFAARGVTVDSTGATVVAVALMFAFAPSELRVPAGRPVTFRLTTVSATSSGKWRAGRSCAACITGGRARWSC